MAYGIATIILIVLLAGVVYIIRQERQASAPTLATTARPSLDRPAISSHVLVMYENGRSTGVTPDILEEAELQPARQRLTVSIDEVTGEIVCFLFDDLAQHQRFFARYSVELRIRQIRDARVYLVGFRSPTVWSDLQTPIALHSDSMLNADVYDYGVVQPREVDEERRDG